MLVVCLAVIFKAVNWGQGVMQKWWPRGAECPCKWRWYFKLSLPPVLPAHLPLCLPACCFVRLFLPHRAMGQTRFAKFNINHWFNWPSKLKDAIWTVCPQMSSSYFLFPLKLTSQILLLAVLFHIPLPLRFFPSCLPTEFTKWEGKSKHLYLEGVTLCLSNSLYSLFSFLA